MNRAQEQVCTDHLSSPCSSRKHHVTMEAHHVGGFFVLFLFFGGGVECRESCVMPGLFFRSCVVLLGVWKYVLP